MKLSYFYLILLIPFLFQTPIQAQDVTLDEGGFEIFEMQDGDSTIIMKKYFFVMLRKGENRDRTPEEAGVLQQEHLSYMDSLAQIGKIKLAGPFGSDGDWRGLVVYNVPTEEEANALAKRDPAVMAGSLAVDLLPWWSLKGACLE